MKSLVTAAQADWNEQNLQPIRDRVYSYLRNAILCGEYRAGDRLIERNLAKKLNISRTPIREALFRLESQKFVTTIPRKGVVVNDIDRDEIIEIFTILASLESVAARFAAMKVDDDTRAACDEEIRTLKALKEQMLAEGSTDAPVENNLNFNDLLGQASKNMRLHEMLADLKDYVRAFTRMSSQRPGRAIEALEEHIQILDAVREGLPDLAENCARLHVEKAKQAFTRGTNSAAPQPKMGAVED